MTKDDKKKEAEDVDCFRFECKKFKPENLKPDRVVLLVGKRGTGKSVLLCDLMYHLSRNYDVGIAFSPTEDTIEDFSKFIMESCIYRDVSQVPVVLGRLIKTLQSMNQQKKRKSVFVILDDCMFDKKVLKSTEIRDVFMNGRHYDILFVNCMQYVMDMSTDLRTNVDYVFALKENIPANRERLQKYFFGVVDMPTFDIIFNKFTCDNKCIVLDNIAKSNKIEDQIFWYRARYYNPEFILGNRSAWKLHYLTYKPPVFEQEKKDYIPGLKRNKERKKLMEELEKNGNHAAVNAALIAPSQESKQQQQQQDASQSSTNQTSKQQPPNGKKITCTKISNSKKKRDRVIEIVELEEEGPEHFVNAAQLKAGIPDTPQGAKQVADQWNAHVQKLNNQSLYKTQNPHPQHLQHPQQHVQSINESNNNNSKNTIFLSSNGPSMMSAPLKNHVTRMLSSTVSHGEQKSMQPFSNHVQEPATSLTKQNQGQQQQQPKLLSTPLKPPPPPPYTGLATNTMAVNETAQHHQQQPPSCTSYANLVQRIQSDPALQTLPDTSSFQNGTIRIRPAAPSVLTSFTEQQKRLYVS